MVRREGELLVLRRAPERLGYWSLVAGGLEPEETPRIAAQRELLEETGLREEVRELPVALTYSLLDDPPAIRARYAPRRRDRDRPCVRRGRPGRLGADAGRRARRPPLVRPR